MIALVGSTGFVGSNLCAMGQFDETYHSTNVAQAFGTKPELLVYAGLRAEKYLADSNPEADMRMIFQAEENIVKIEPEKLVLISTVDVLKDPVNKDEDAEIDTDGLQAYGLNRYHLEQWVRSQIPDALIIRLPGLYGINLKKNFIYDMIHIIPSILNESKFISLSAEAPELRQYYFRQDNGFYKCVKLKDTEEKMLKKAFRRLNFTALNFTDSRNIYQFYPLARLWEDMMTALENGLTLLHLATEPVSASELYAYVMAEPFVNEFLEHPVQYDYRTKYDKLFSGTGGYLMDKQQVLDDVRRFISAGEKT